jgi:fermentation-respiration switch protein FrsA (DUF1100 family)
LLAALFVLLLGGPLVVSLFEERMVFTPLRWPEGDWEPAGLRHQEVWFASEDGTRLHAWYLPAARSRGHLLYLHGDHANLTSQTAALRALRDELDLDVLVFDYRGFGRSQGSPDEAGVLADARAARRLLAARAGVGEGDLVLLGRSLGGTVAVLLAAELPPRGLILESTFPSIPEIAEAHHPWLPARLLMRTRFDAGSAIGRYPGPLFQSHGTADRVAPLELGRRLFDAAPGAKRWLELAGLDHADRQPEECLRELDGWLHGIGLPRQGKEP